MHNAIIVFNTSLDVTERCVGDIIQTRIGGSLYAIESRKAQAPVESNAIHVGPDKLEDLYCQIASTQDPCTVQVAIDRLDDLRGFMEKYPGTAGDFRAAVVTTTRSTVSQERAIYAVEQMVRVGMERDKARLLLVHAPRNHPLETIYPKLMEYWKDACAQASGSPAVLYESVAFSKIREHQLPVAAMLNRDFNFQTMLEAARGRGDNEEVLRDLSQKLLAQRALDACRNDIETAMATLRLRGDTALKPHQPSSHLRAPEEDSVVADALEAMPVTTCAAESNSEVAG